MSPIRTCEPLLVHVSDQHGCVPKTLNPTIVVMKSAQDGA
jgi:hypothetical protein